MCDYSILQVEWDHLDRQNSCCRYHMLTCCTLLCLASNLSGVVEGQYFKSGQIIIKYYPTTSKFTKGTSTISPFSSLTSAARARNPLGSELSPTCKLEIAPIIPALGGRRIRTVCPTVNAS